MDAYVVVATGKASDISSFRVYADGKTKVDDDFIFYGQVKNLDNTITCNVQNNETSTTFELDLPKIISEASKITFGATSEFSNLAELDFIKIEVRQGFMTLVQCEVDLNNRSELALILGEVYRHNGAWKFRFISQGFNGGLQALAEFYGVEIAQEAETEEEIGEEIIEDIENVNTEKTENLTTEKLQTPEIIHKENKAKENWLKKIPNTESGLSLKKHIVHFDKVIANTLLADHKARVVVAIDVSASINKLFRNGTIQKTLNRLAPLALKFDDDGKLDVWYFIQDPKRMKAMTIDNYENYTEKNFSVRRRMQKEVPDFFDPRANLTFETSFGGTQFFHTFNAIIRTYSMTVSNFVKNLFRFSKSNEEKTDKINPVFLICITDIYFKTNELKRIREALKEHVDKQIFVLFFALEQGRDNIYESNAATLRILNINDISDEELYQKLLKKYMKWLEK